MDHAMEVENSESMSSWSIPRSTPRPWSDVVSDVAIRQNGGPASRAGYAFWARAAARVQNVEGGSASVEASPL